MTETKGFYRTKRKDGKMSKPRPITGKTSERHAPDMIIYENPYVKSFEAIKGEEDTELELMLRKRMFTLDETAELRYLLRACESGNKLLRSQARTKLRILVPVLYEEAGYGVADSTRKLEYIRKEAREQAPIEKVAEALKIRARKFINEQRELMKKRREEFERRLNVEHKAIQDAKYVEKLRSAPVTEAERWASQLIRDREKETGEKATRERLAKWFDEDKIREKAEEKLWEDKFLKKLERKDEAEAYAELAKMVEATRGKEETVEVKIEKEAE